MTRTIAPTHSLHTTYWELDFTFRTSNIIVQDSQAGHDIQCLFLGGRGTPINAQGLILVLHSEITPNSGVKEIAQR